MTTTHQTYKASSPYYQSILARYGRSLSAGQVVGILAEHGLTETDYSDDVLEGRALPLNTDAAELLAWLGY